MSLEKYSLGKPSQTNKIADYENDSYSTSIVEDLLASTTEWRNVQDIVRMTFKALTEVVKNQGETIRELEKQFPTKASKTELHSGLSLKANVSDVTKSVADLSSSLEGRLSFEDCQLLLKDYVLKSDFQYLMSNKASIDELKILLQGKASVEDHKSEITALYNKYEDWGREINKKLANFALQRDLDVVVSTVDLKANIAEMNEQLEGKANKQSVVNALHKKANKADFEALIAQKADQVDVSKLINLLDSKIDSVEFEKIYQTIQNKVDREEFEALMKDVTKKANKNDLEQIHSTSSVKAQERDSSVHKRVEALKSEIEGLKEHVLNQLAKKTDTREIERITNLVMNKCDQEFVNGTVMRFRGELSEEIGEVRSEMKRLLEDQVFKKEKKQEEIFEQLAEDVYKLNEQIQNIINERKNDIDETAKFVKSMITASKRELQSQTEKFEEDLEKIKKQTEDLTTKKIDKKDLGELKAKLMASLETKVDITEVQNVINTSQQDVSARFYEYKEEMKAILLENENEIFNLLSKKANISDINAALSNKADISVIQGILGQKMSMSEIDDVKRKIATLVGAFEEKANSSDFTQFVKEVKEEFEHLKKDSSKKANIKDVCKLIDAKSNIEDVNKALVEIHKELDTKLAQKELKAALDDQAAINESLCTETIVGRWAWKSGELKSGNSVPWEIQLANTLPDNFLWEKDKSSVLAVAPGLYEINFGFFAKKKPSIQVMVNGEPILSAVNTASYVIHHPTGKTKEMNINKHPSGNITGLTLVEFVVLPARARVSLIYTGEPGGEGFLGLKRL